MKILGAAELWRCRFHYRPDTVFNTSTYLAFLEQLAHGYRRQGALLIQDDASYHKDREVWAWFRANRSWLEVHQLPPYSPEFNPTERLWQHTRKNGTHNRYFTSIMELLRADAGFGFNPVMESLEARPARYAVVARLTQAFKRLLPGLRYESANPHWEMAEFEHRPHEWPHARRFAVARRFIPEQEPQTTLFTLAARGNSRENR